MTRSIDVIVSRLERLAAVARDLGLELDTRQRQRLRDLFSALIDDLARDAGVGRESDPGRGRVHSDPVPEPGRERGRWVVADRLIELGIRATDGQRSQIGREAAAAHRLANGGRDPETMLRVVNGVEVETFVYDDPGAIDVAVTRVMAQVADARARVKSRLSTPAQLSLTAAVNRNRDWQPMGALARAHDPPTRGGKGG